MTVNPFKKWLLTPVRTFRYKLCEQAERHLSSAWVGSHRVFSGSLGSLGGRASAASVGAREQRHWSARTAGTPGRTEASTDAAPLRWVSAWSSAPFSALRVRPAGHFSLRGKLKVAARRVYAANFWKAVAFSRADREAGWSLTSTFSPPVRLLSLPPGWSPEECGASRTEADSWKFNFQLFSDVSGGTYQRTGSWLQADLSQAPRRTFWRSGRRSGRKWEPKCWGTSPQPLAQTAQAGSRAPSSPTTETRTEAPPLGTAYHPPPPPPPATRWLGPPPARLWRDPRRKRTTLPTPLHPRPPRRATWRRPLLRRRRLSSPPRTPAPWLAMTATRKVRHPAKGRRRRAPVPAPGRGKGRSRRGSWGRRGDQQVWSAYHPTRWVTAASLLQEVHNRVTSPWVFEASGDGQTLYLKFIEW